MCVSLEFNVTVVIVQDVDLTSAGVQVVEFIQESPKSIYLEFENLVLGVSQLFEGTA